MARRPGLEAHASGVRASGDEHGEALSRIRSRSRPSEPERPCGRGPADEPLRGGGPWPGRFAPGPPNAVLWASAAGLAFRFGALGFSSVDRHLDPAVAAAAGL